MDRRDEELNDKEHELKEQWLGRHTKSRRAPDKSGNPLLLFAYWSTSAARPEQTDLYVVAYYDKKRRAGFAPFELVGTHALIVDIQNGDHINKGVGTCILTFAEEVLIDLGARTASGELSATDADHRPRQVRFYEKNGYTVVLDGSDGTVTKHLS